MTREIRQIAQKILKEFQKYFPEYKEMYEELAQTGDSHDEIAETLLMGMLETDSSSGTKIGAAVDDYGLQSDDIDDLLDLVEPKITQLAQQFAQQMKMSRENEKARFFGKQDR